MENSRRSLEPARDLDAVLAVLRRHEAEIRAAGIDRASVFGSLARGTAGPDSDVDIAVHFAENLREGGLEYVGLLLSLKARLEMLLGRPVDIAPEPARRAAFGQAIERDRVVAFE